MTRAAHRILNQARANAWRRIGIPASWGPGSPVNADSTPSEAAADDATSSGKNVAAPASDDAGTGRPNGADNKPSDEATTP